ncbi:molybdopterin-dependent oxidoreductase [Haloarchaeobius iranensis]|uniref:Oxidoreductase molybdopterin binding domain-containing protein n=1 Tax=Haloarchaeobius iranensis TaxID=996166 RepID=A0A1H0BH36_9EURY|nr:molybdopterin-dependent oxidoreductase [Haloarchaeobius iranensis]SDN44974.1 Oxidoreductase molybdopterin binding domain-containing protein [Haloarchaeobius iranensis]
MRRLPFEPPPRVVDAGILVSVLVAGATGLLSLTARPDEGWVFVVHGVVGLTLVVLLGFKLRRVWRRVAGSWTRTVAVSVLLSVLAVAALVTGVAWTLGAESPVPGVTLLVLHGYLGALVLPVLLIHLAARFRLPDRETVTERRQALRVGGLLVGGAAAWRLKQSVAGDLVPSRRFTGSREDGSGEGNAFPVTSWVADDPEPVDVASWTLDVRGAVAAELSLSEESLLAPASGGPNATDGERALLDCTSGWYSEHDWRGVRVGDLLDAAGADPDAGYVRFRSVTGYRWSLPTSEARDALLATHVDGERLSHGHGFPCRLVAPGRRGFQWVKWVHSVEVRHDPDPAQWVATLVSGFDGDGSG